MFRQSDKEAEIRPSSEELKEHYSLDSLAMEMADGTLTRGRALKYMGVALLGGVGAMAGLGTLASESEAKKHHKKKKKKKTGAKAKSCPAGKTKCVGPGGTIYCCPGTALDVCNLLNTGISACVTL